ncbi:VOC family protein [Paenibacillus farraposensis]|uniref:VOC family protein n=1 Tax=Paenibacillus farraposensis TaxID=2807095 RepID=A0ABW4DAM2_9BACL|nr:VOC family protein [Paenibacillus farraposensis]MCC3379019.1 VOC family protein [Paenibacillus farraposensis]
MKSASPYIIVNDVQQTVDYYQSVLGGEIKVLNKQEGKFLHAELHLGNSLIHFSDSYGKPLKAQHVQIILDCESEEELKRAYHAFAEKGTITVELQDTFFGALHGQVTDHLNQIEWVMNYFKR